MVVAGARRRVALNARVRAALDVAVARRVGAARRDARLDSDWVKASGGRPPTQVAATSALEPLGHKHFRWHGLARIVGVPFALAGWLTLRVGVTKGAVRRPA